ncbi:MAG: phosphatidylserine/phosphatidylglycerophosphate/cardiolipin synthase family protein [bacterium]
MRYKFFANSQKSWQAMFNAISVAKKSVYLEMYIFQDGMVEFDFLKLIKQKASEGLRVRIILDSFGSSNLSKKAVMEIRESGAEIFFLSYLFHRTHRKILIVDEQVAFIGGVNFQQSSSLWNDLVVQSKGKLVSVIIRSFAKSYVECGGLDQSIISLSKRNNVHRKIPRIRKKMHDWIIEHSPVKNRFRLKKIYTNHLSKAKKDIVLLTPYLIPKRWFIGLLHQAHLRGVNVEILVPRDTDHYVIDRINYYYMCKLSKLGIKFYLEPKMNHAKIMVIDSKDAIIGSNNLDFLSFEFNSEIGIFFKDPHAILKITKIIDVWKKESVFFDPGSCKMKWFDYVLFPVISLFLRFL